MDNEFTKLLGEIESGAASEELAEKCRAMVAAVMDVRKPGKIKLVLTFAPTGKGLVKIDADVEATIPEHDRPSTMFFTGENGTLHRRDPNQPDLPLKEADAPERGTTNLRVI